VKAEATQSRQFPRMARVRQNFPVMPSVDVSATLREQFERIRAELKPNATVAVGVGSRGITNLAGIVRVVLDLLRGAGARPFIFPAMGSHGGATAEGQTELLASYGVTEAAMGAPIRASMEVRQVGTTSAGAPVYSSVEALAADHIVLVNRIKPHTDFFGAIGSGIIKMSVIGLGKREGAAAMHITASRHGHEAVIREMAGIVFAKTPILGGVAILENQAHETATLHWLKREEIFLREPALKEEASRLMPSIPFEEIDLLIIDRIGKNISGAGLDPNVVGRGVNGYTSELARGEKPAPFIRRIFVRDLTEETHGNAIGIGNADITTTRLVNGMDRRVMYMNALTALTPQSAKIPIYFDTDRECMERALGSLALGNVEEARVLRIADTLNLIEFQASESLLDEIKGNPILRMKGAFEPMRFDAADNLIG
jgi:hypothetical protein